MLLVTFSPLLKVTEYCLGQRPSQHLLQSGPITKSSSPGAFTIRNAELTDLNDVTTILASAFAGSPAWDYGYQFRTEYPEYHWCCLCEQLRRDFEQRDVNTVWIKVLEIEIDDTERSQKPEVTRKEQAAGKTKRVVSVAVWKVLDQNAPGYWDPHESSEVWKLKSDVTERIAHDDKQEEHFDCSLHLDMNMTRTSDFQRQISKLRRPYIEDAYLKQLHLEELATHPDFQGRGYAAELVRWGMKEAKSLDLGPVTLVSTPAGYELYRALGFVDLGEVLVGRLDGRGKLWFEATRWSL